VAIGPHEEVALRRCSPAFCKPQGKKTFDVLVELLCGSDKHKILDLVPTRETPLEPVNSSRHAPAPFAVLDINCAHPSAGLAAVPV